MSDVIELDVENHYGLDNDMLEAVMDALEPFHGQVSNCQVIGVLELAKANYLFE